MKKLFILFIIYILSLASNVYAVQLHGANGDIKVTESTVTVTVDANIDPTINKVNIILDVYDDTNKKVVAGPTTIQGKVGETTATGSVDISKLDGSRTYILRGKEANQDGDTFEKSFNTLSKPEPTVTPETPANSKCVVDRAGFYPNGETNDSFYRDGKTKLGIVIKTINCANQELKLTVKEMDRCAGSILPGYNCNNPLDKSNLENFPIKIEASEAMTMNFTAGEENCETMLGGVNVPDGYDCLYYFELTNPAGEKWSSMDRPGGRIYYECDGTCMDNWKWLSNEEDTIDAGAIDNRLSSSDYTLLAPIGDIKKIDDSTKLGDYINLIIKIFLGVCGALAVIMMIIYGVQWMGTDSVFGKTEAKQKIAGTLMGLILALASWVILNTINPDLLGGELNIGQARVEVEDALTANDELPPVGTAAGRCPEGIYQVSTSGGMFPACKTITDKIKLMIDDAWKQNLNITGFGFRSKAKQEELRAKYCGGQANIYNPNAKCKPDVAMPGTSMHESGLAFDLRCDGSKISTQDNKCYIWLKNNASKYGFKNLASEPWHWSTTGF